MGLLGHALARAAGQPYRSLLRERILEPLGMDDTGFTLSGANAEWLTQGHQAGEVVPRYTGTAAIDGAGGLLSNVEDMLRFLKANAGPPTTELERVLRNAHRVRRQFTDGRDMGLGWRIDYEEGRALLGHGGTTGGYRTYVGLDPSAGIGFVLLTNTSRFDDDIGRDFLRYGQPLDLSVVDVSPAVLAPYAGEYAYREDRSMFVRLEDEGYLTLQVPGDPRLRLYSESEASFFAKRHPWRITFDLTEEGEVLRVTSEYLDGVISGPKVGNDVPPPRTVAGN